MDINPVLRWLTYPDGFAAGLGLKAPQYARQCLVRDEGESDLSAAGCLKCPGAERSSSTEARLCLLRAGHDTEKARLSNGCLDPAE